MTIAVLIWTVATGAPALLSGLAGFIVARAVLGFGEGATFPGGLKTALDSLPKRLHSRGTSLCYSGAAIGAIITPLIVTPIAVRYGWRFAFMVTAVAVYCGWPSGWVRFSQKPSTAARGSPYFQQSMKGDFGVSSSHTGSVHYRSVPFFI